MDWLNQMEGGFLLFLQKVARTPLLDHVMNGITTLGDGGIGPILTCGVLLFFAWDNAGGLRLRRGTAIGLTGILALLLEVLLINLVLKGAVGRIRPYEAIEGLACITSIPHDFSFPSGHTGSCFAVAAVIFIEMPRRVGIFALVIAGLVGFSRLYLGAHYPTDVLAGAVIGIACAVLAEKILSKAAWIKGLE